MLHEIAWRAEQMYRAAARRGRSGGMNEDPVRRGQRRQHLHAEEPADARRLQTSSSLAMALRAWRWRCAEKPEIILMDLGLPVLDGLEATRRIKAAPETRHIPVIALTAKRDDRRQGEGARRGLQRLRYQADGAAAPAGQDPALLPEGGALVNSVRSRAARCRRQRGQSLHADPTAKREG